VAIKLIQDFGSFDYDCAKVVREIQILKGIQSTGKKGVCCFTPELIDVIVPEGQERIETLQSIFLVLQYEQTDMRKLIRLGSDS